MDKSALGVLVDEKRVNDILKQKSGAKVFVRSACNLLFFIMFLTLYTVWAVLMDPVTDNRAFERYIRNRFDLGATYPLHSVESIEDFWNYTEFSFMSGLYGNDTRHYSFPNAVIPTMLPIDHSTEETRLLAVARIRMARVRSGIECVVTDMYEPEFPNCYGPYTEDAVTTSDFGPTAPEGWKEFQYSSDADGVTYAGKVATYLPGGYMEVMGANYTAAKERVDMLYASRWVDEATRAIWIDFTLYNFNLGLYAVCQIVFEVSPSGSWVKTFGVEVLTQRYMSPLGFGTFHEWAMLMIEAVIFLCVIRYVCEELAELLEVGGGKLGMKLNYWSDGWNLLDWLNLLLIVVVLGYRIDTWVKAPDMTVVLEDPSRVDLNSFTNFNCVVENIRTIRTVTALNMVFTWLKAVKYVKILPYISTFMSTVKYAWRMLVSFAFVFTAIFLGFLLGYSVACGDRLPEFRTTWKAAIFLLRSFLGNANFGVVFKQSPLMGSFLILLFILVVYFIIMNLLYAIVLSALGDAKGNQDTHTRRAWLKNLEHVKSFWATLERVLSLEYRFRTCFGGLSSRQQKWAAKRRAKEKERDEDYAARMRAKQPQENLEEMLGPASPGMGRRKRGPMARHESDEHSDEEIDDDISEPDLGPLKSREQLHRAAGGGIVSFAPNISGGGMLATSDPRGEALDLVMKATKHVTHGIVGRTNGARSLVVREMQDSRQMLHGIGKVLEVLNQRARDLEAQQVQLLRRY